MWIVYSLIIVVALLFSCCCYFYRLAVCPGKKPFLSGNKDLPEIFLGGLCVEGKEWLLRIKKSELTIKSTDSLQLKALFIPSSSEKQNVFAVMAHGYNSSSRDMGPYAKFFNQELDFHVLLPDDRGHGKSDGGYIGFGWHDRVDCHSWIKYLIGTYGSDIKIILFGVSMGGATVLMLSGEKLPDNVKAIISDCAYTSAADILACQLKRQFRLPSFPCITMTSLITKFKAGYFLKDASALKQVKKAKVPILFIHGRKDTFVPFTMVYELFDACRTRKKLFISDDAGHGESFIKSHDAYCETVRDFIRSTV